jgi:hypothetical protein
VKITFQLACILALVSTTLLAKEQPTAVADPGGWGAAKWGMTSDQVKAAVPGAKKGRPKVFSIGEGPDYSLQFHKATVYGVKATINFGFDKAGRLTSVLIQPNKETMESFQALKAGLDAELGEGLLDPSAGARIEARWTLPSTKVLLLSYDAMRDPLVKANQYSLPYITAPSLMLIYEEHIAK